MAESLSKKCEKVYITISAFAGMADLTRKHCVSCEGDVKLLASKEIEKYLNTVGAWQLNKQGHITRTFAFSEFLPAMDFVNRVAKLAEQEGHHPDFYIHYNIVELEIWTHSINGLTENDFILAAKIDKLFSNMH